MLIVPSRLTRLITVYCLIQLAELPKFCDAVFIATLDSQHYEPAVAFANMKYHILLEKPMAPTLQECYKITQAALKNQVIISIEIFC